MEYNDLLDMAASNDVKVYENYPFESNRIKGLYCDNTIALSKSLQTSVEKACVLAEELGHYHTSSGDIIDQSSVMNRKQERQARLWAYNKQIGLIGLIEAYKRGCHSSHEAADFLGVTEEFFQNAIEHYREKYGCCAELDHYIIFFEPTLTVMERMEVQP